MKSKILIFFNGVGSVIEIDNAQTTSGDYGQIYDAFAIAAGFRGDAWPQAQTLRQSDCFNGVYYDMELVGPDGASYRIHCLPDNDRCQIETCKAYICRSFDCVRMQMNRIKRLIDFEMPELRHETIDMCNN